MSLTIQNIDVIYDTCKCFQVQASLTQASEGSLKRCVKTSGTPPSPCDRLPSHSCSDNGLLACVVAFVFGHDIEEIFNEKIKYLK